MQKLHEGLSRPRTRKALDHVWQRIGRIQEQSRGAAQHYQVEVVADLQGDKAVAVLEAPAPPGHHAAAGITFDMAILDRDDMAVFYALDPGSGNRVEVGCWSPA